MYTNELFILHIIGTLKHTKNYPVYVHNPLCVILKLESIMP